MRKNLFIVLLVVAANLGIWAAFNRPIAEEPWHGMINGFSYSPYGRDDNPLESRMPKPDAIDRDLALLAQYGRSVRTYSAIDGLEVIPALAQKHGLQVTLGAWLDQRTELNKREIDSLIDLGKRYDNVTRLVVGNEAILRADLTVRELAQYLRQVRKAVNKPVSTAEPWHVWLRFPELVQEVDFIAVQVGANVIVFADTAGNNGAAEDAVAGVAAALAVWGRGGDHQAHPGGERGQGAGL